MNALVMLLALGSAGALGAVGRYGVMAWTAQYWRGHFPLATFLINVSGAFALGLLATLGPRLVPITAEARTILGTGFLGGYTTFSTLSFETNALARRGLARHAWLNAAGALVAGVLAAGIGMYIGAVLT